MESPRPTLRMFLPTIHSLAKAGEMRRALDVVNMMRRSGCICTVQTYNTLITGLVEKASGTLLNEISVLSIFSILLVLI